MLIQNISNTAHSYESARPAGDNSSAVAANTSVKMPAPQSVQDSKPDADIKTSAAQLQSAVDNTNKALQASNRNLAFSVDADTNKTVVKLMDSKTGDLIGQFPSHQMLEISKAIGVMQEQLQQATLSKSPVQSTPGLLIKQHA